MEDCISKSPNSGRPLSLDAIRYHGVLKSYDTSDSQIPIESLRQTLRKNENIVHKIDPYLFEKLVGSVMRDFYANCVVNFCGRSGDGGIDLFLIESDKTIAIQVKRRIHPNSVERIQAVREFLGASLAQGIDHLIYVSTARSFSGGVSGAKTFAKRVVDQRVVRSFQLVNRDQFFSMLRTISDTNEKPWRKFLPDFALAW
jgi:restriction endonuclease Mrr